MQQRKCYLISMRRLMHILFVLAFAVTSAVAAPLAVCQHAGANAHAAALASSDASIVMAAQIEDSADAALEKRTPVAEVGAGTLAAVILPNIYSATPRLMAQATRWFADPPAELAGRSILPLLNPPLN
jgi:hypothetical protein